MLETTDSAFEKDVLKASLPVLVDFWAPWCGPCRMLAPIVEELAQDTEGYLIVVKINIDENPLIPSQYGVRSIPSLILFNQGQPIGVQVGLQHKQGLIDWAKGLLAEILEA